MSDSTDVFGALVAENDAPQTSVASYEDYAPYLSEQAQAIREQGRKGVDVLRKIGEILAFTREETPHGYYQRWLVDMRDLYMSTGGEDGFNISKATDENYRDLYLVSTAFGGELYKRYKMLGATFLYHHIAPLIKQDHPIERIVEHVEVVRKTPRLLTSGKSDDPCMDTYKEQFPAVYDLFNTGKLSETMACDICENVINFEPRVMYIVHKFGCQSLDAATELNITEQSIQRAKLEGVPYTDIIEEIIKFNGLLDTGGLFALDEDEGTQVAIDQMTALMIKTVYHNARKEHGASESAAKKVFDEALNKEEAIKLALKYGYDAKAEAINKNSDKTTYVLKLVQETPKPKVD